MIMTISMGGRALTDDAVVVLIIAAGGAGVAPLLGLLGQLVVRIHGGDVLLPQSVDLLPEVVVHLLQLRHASNGGISPLVSLGVEGFDHGAELVEGGPGVIVVLVEPLLGLLHLHK